MRTLTVFLMAGMLAACSRGGDPAADARRAAGEPTASYARRMIFVGGTGAAPQIVVFDHLALASEAAVERSASFWRSAEEAWQPLLDLKWSDEPIREPWRLVPHGPFRIMVDDAGEVEELRGRGALESFTLARVGSLGEWNPEDPVLYRINLGEWTVGSDSVAGILVDIHPGAAPAEGAPAPTELVLTDGAEFRLVATMGTVAESNPPGELWLQRGGRTESLTPAAVVRDSVVGSDIWHVNGRGGELHGELRPLAPTLLREGGTRLGGRTTLLALQGWVEFRGERRNVFGVMRRAAS
jgi:hypothetical protein